MAVIGSIWKLVKRCARPNLNDESKDDLLYQDVSMAILAQGQQSISMEARDKNSEASRHLQVKQKNAKSKTSGNCAAVGV